MTCLFSQALLRNKSFNFWNSISTSLQPVHLHYCLCFLAAIQIQHRGKKPAIFVLLVFKNIYMRYLLPGKTVTLRHLSVPFLQCHLL